MTRQLFIWTAFITVTTSFTSCNGQVQTNSTKVSTGGQPKIIKNHLIPEFSYDFFSIQCGLQDKAGNMWFGGGGDGIYYYDGKFFFNFNRTDDLNLNDIMCCLEDNSGIIWFGTRRGLIRYKPSGKQPKKKDFTSYLIPANIISKSTRTRLPYTIQPYDNFVWSIMQDEAGKIWFGTSKGIYIHNPATDNDSEGPLFSRLLDSDTLINNNQLKLMDISVMMQDKNGNIWFASAWAKSEGIVRYDGKSLANFAPDSNYAFRSIIEKKNGDLLFLSPYHGVYSYDGKTFSNLNEKIGIKNDTLFAMIEDKAGTLWLGRHSENMKNGGNGGVWRYDGKALKLFTTKDGLSHNCVWCIVEDKDGNIWFGTRNMGLCRYDGKTFTDYTE